MKNTIVFNLLVVTALLVGALPAPAMARSAAVPPAAQDNPPAVAGPAAALPVAPDDPPAQIEQALLDKLTTEGVSDFFVIMAEKADLSAAFTMDWSARGRYVYDTLRQVASRAQSPIIEYAQKRGLRYRSFFTNNAVMIEGGRLEAVQAIAALPGVELVRLPKVAYLDPIANLPKSANFDLVVQPAAAPTAYGWNLDALNPAGGQYGMQAAQVWSQYSTRGENVVVANIDSGVYYQHVALDRQYRGNQTGAIGGPYNHDFNWYMPTSGCASATEPCDNAGHGSGTMGIMVGETADLTEQNGAAPGAKWIACKGCEGLTCSDLALTACADWIVAPCPIGMDPGDPGCDPDMRPHVVNNSWGGAGGRTWYQGYVQAWVAAGIFPAFSAGNTTACSAVGSPGDNPEAFGTAAHNSAGVNQYAGGPSAFFPTPSCAPNAHQVDPHLNAPTFGRTPDNSQGAYYSLSGTSGASPHTAGAVALIWSANPTFIGQIDSTFILLEQFSNHNVPAGTCGKPACAGSNNYPNYEYGWGYLDALAAVEQALLLGGPGKLVGTVTDSSTANPINEAQIDASLSPTLTWSATTNALGNYLLTIFSGTYTVTAGLYGYYSKVLTDVDVLENYTTTLNIALDPIPSFVVSGTVTDATTGWPLYTRLDIPEYPASPVWTDPATGFYSVTLAGDGVYNFHVEAWVAGYVPQDRAVALNSNRTENFALEADLDACAAPGYQPGFDWYEDFEGDNGGFTVSGAVPSWAWGLPTSGPGNAHSGSSAWATNLGGNYNFNEDSYLTSPLINLSAFAGQGIYLSWWQWLQSEIYFDFASVEVSNNGGSSWTLIYGEMGGHVDLAWARRGVMLDSSYAVSNFRVRFRLRSDSLYSYPGWYVDDIGLFAVPALPPPVLSQGFEGTFPPAGWALYQTSDQTEWERGYTGSSGSHGGPYSGTYYAWHDDDDITDPDGLAWLVSSQIAVPSGFALQFFDRTYSVGYANYHGVWISTGSGNPGDGQFVELLDLTTRKLNAWANRYVDLSAYAGQNVYLAFRYNGDDNDEWYIDAVSVGVGEEWGVAPCVPGTGGLVVGNAYDNNTGVPLNGVVVESEDDYNTVTAAAPGPAGDGFYYLYSPAGGKVFTATLTSYSQAVATPNVLAGQTIRQDFDLHSAYFVADPNALHATLELGLSTSVPFTLTNAGDAPATFELWERGGGFAPVFSQLAGPVEAKPPAEVERLPDGSVNCQAYQDYVGVELPEVAASCPISASATMLSESVLWPTSIGFAQNLRVSTDNFVSFALNDFSHQTVLGSSANAYYGMDFNPSATILYALNDTTNQLGTIDLTNGDFTGLVACPPGGGASSWSGLSIAADGTFYASTATDLYIINPGVSPCGVTHVGAFGTSLMIDIAINPQGQMYGHDIGTDSIYSIDTATGVATLIGLTGYNANYAQGMDFDNGDGTLYIFLYQGSGANVYGTVDLTTGAVTPLAVNSPRGEFEGAVRVSVVLDVPWLGETPVLGTVPALTDQPITVSFDASVPQVAQPGNYYATLQIVHDTPQDTLLVPVTMTVTAPPSWGLLDGVITGQGYCDSAPAALKGAVVVIEGASGYTKTLKTDVNGYYSWWLDVTYNPLTLTVSYPQHETLVNYPVSVTGGSTTTVDFAPRWLVPCVEAVPLTMHETVNLGAQSTAQLTVTNGGAALTPFGLQEIGLGSIPALSQLAGPVEAKPAPEVERLPDGSVNCHAYEDYVGAELPEVAASCPVNAPATAPSASTLAPTDIGFAKDVSYISDNFVSFALNDFSHQTVLGSSANAYYGMDFDPDATILYALNDTTDQLGSIDLTNGDFTGLVACPPAGGASSWTGLSIAVDGTFYASTATDLYIIDPSISPCGVTHIGAFGTVLMIEIAINPRGQMYGHDIGTDSIYSIDLATGAATLIGPTGYNANFAQGMDFDNGDGTLYIFLYQGSGANVYGTVDLATGAVTPLAVSSPLGEFEGAVQALAVLDVPWLSQAPVSGTLPADVGQAVVDVTFDGDVVAQPGDYYAILQVKTNDPVNDVIGVFVTMTVNALPTWGKLQGVVNSQGHCDSNPTPLAGATLVIENSMGMTRTVQSGAYGDYIRWLEAGAYTVTVSADGHLSNSGAITVAAGSTATLNLDLRWIGPCASTTPEVLDVSVTLGDQLIAPLTLQNVGAGDYSFEMLETTKTLTLNYGKGAGGPDSFGYIYKDSNEPGGPNYEWIDISTTGAPVILGNNEWDGPFEIGFPFNFYGQDQTQFFVGDNGFLSFGAGSTDSGNDSIPSTNTPNDIIALMWDNLDPSGTGDVFYYQHMAPCPYVGGECLIAQYENYHHYSSSGGGAVAGTFQAILFENGNILMQFKDSGAENGSGATTGIENITGTVGLQYGYNTTYLADNLAICFAYPGERPDCQPIDVPWLAEAPITGTVSADGARAVDIIFTAFPTLTTWPSYPVFTATLIVKTSDKEAGNNGKLYIPVTMTVNLPSTYGYLAGVVQSMGYCDSSPVALEGADLVVQSFDGASWATTSGPGGAYQIGVEAIHSPVTVTASYAGHLTVTVAGLTITAQQTTTQDLTLRELIPCAVVTPDKMDEVVLLSSQQTAQLTMQNMGAADMTFELEETSTLFTLEAGSGMKADVPWLAQDPITGTVPAGSVRAVDVTFTAFPTLTTWPSYPVFTATLIVKTNDPNVGPGGELYVPVTMTISTAPFCGFETNSPVNVGDTVLFTNTTTGDQPIEFDWAFGDGGLHSNLISPTHVYSQSGVFTVTLVATNAVGTGSCSQAVYVSGPPVAGFISNSPIYLGEFAVFTNTTTSYPAASVWFWNFGAAATPATSSQQNPGSVIFSTAGVRTVSLTASNGVIDAYEALFTVCSAPMAGVSMSQPASIKVGEVITMTAIVTPNNLIPAPTIVWSTGEIGLQITHVFTVAGQYTMALTVTNACDQMVHSALMTIEPAGPVYKYIYLPLVTKNSG